MSNDKKEIQVLLKRLREANRGILNPEESETLLAHYGIAMVKSKTVGNDPEAIVQCARSIGFPLAIKVISPKVLHKSDAGLVRLRVRDEEEVREAYREMISSAQNVLSDGDIDGVLVQRMIEEGHEIIVGLTNDPTFGRVLLFGLGGIFVEILKDVAIRKTPITPSDALDMIHEIRGLGILRGARGKPAANLDAIRDLLLKTSRLAMELEELQEMDLNPVFVNAEKATVADARIILRS